jgi:hypothetical protein
MRRFPSTVFAAVLLSLSATVAAADLGAPLPDGDPVGIAVAADDPAAHAGKPALFAGRITDVCTKKGCWAVLEHDGRSARVMVKDHAFAIPADARGDAIVYGTLDVEPISDEHARHLVEDDGAAPPAERDLRITATAIRLP